MWSLTRAGHSALMVPTGRSRHKPMSLRIKSWIKGMRRVQLGLRVLEIVAAIGLIAVTSVAGLIGWILGATVGSPSSRHGLSSLC